MTFSLLNSSCISHLDNKEKRFLIADFYKENKAARLVVNLPVVLLVMVYYNISEDLCLALFNEVDWYIELGIGFAIIYIIYTLYVMIITKLLISSMFNRFIQLRDSKI